MAPARTLRRPTTRTTNHLLQIGLASKESAAPTDLDCRGDIMARINGINTKGREVSLEECRAVGAKWLTVPGLLFASSFEGGSTGDWSSARP